jgi:hypothetical protein
MGVLVVVPGGDRVSGCVCRYTAEIRGVPKLASDPNGIAPDCLIVCDEQAGPKSRPTPDRVTLDRMGDHIGYELQSAASGVSRYERDDGVLDLEAGLLHTRALIEFLVGRPRRNPRDVCPTDYQPTWLNRPGFRDCSG